MTWLDRRPQVFAAWRFHAESRVSAFASGYPEDSGYPNTRCCSRKNADRLPAAKKNDFFPFPDLTISKKGVYYMLS